MEYNWQPESKYTRAELADRYLPPPWALPPGFREPISYEGGTDHWESKTIVQSDSSAAQVLEQINSFLLENAKRLNWSRVDSGGSKDTTKSVWKFIDEKGGVWNGLINVQPVVGERNKLTVTMRINRSNAAGLLPGGAPDSRS
jgi:hypothetical protein